MIRRTILALIAPLLGAPASAAAADPSDRDLFHKEVWPLLQRACVTCHGEDDPENGLRVDSRQALLQGGKSGPAVKPGAPDDSLLIQVVRWNHKDLLMPPKKKLPAREIALLEAWVRRGVPWPAPEATAAKAAQADTGPRWRPTWWSGPPRLQAPPALASLGGRARGEIDRFVFGTLESLGMEPVALASRRAWLRRVTHALTGGLPTAAEIDAFTKAADENEPRARAEVVDRVLGSAAYARHWARLWTRAILPEAPEGSAYEGWMAGALARDRPVDEIVRAHLPGLAPGEPGTAARAFLALAAERRDPDQGPRDAQVAAVGRAFLALEVDCARCHDHPTDPMRAAEYQALAALVAPADGPRAEAPAPPRLGTAESPLVGRVIVNRVWREHMGRGLVDTVDDFGAAGEPPSHPALLEHLAARLAEKGGSLRWLHREILLSATFGLAVAPGAGQDKRDPDNVFLWRAHARTADDRAVDQAWAALAPGGKQPLAARVWQRAPEVAPLYRLVLGRDPSAAEAEAATAFLAARPGRGPALAETLLRSQEFRLLR